MYARLTKPMTENENWAKSIDSHFMKYFVSYKWAALYVRDYHKLS